MLVPTISKTRLKQAPYQPFGAARQLWSCKDPEVLVSGPAGTGKTRAILEKIFGLCVKYPGSRHLICRKTRASMTQSVLVTLEEKVLPPGVLRGGSGPARQYRQSYKIGQSEIVVGGLDNPERTFSTEYDTVTVFEAIEVMESEWDALQRSLRNGKMRTSPDAEPYHQAIADTNPGSPTHWLKIRADRQKKMTHLRSKHEDNPQFYDHKIGQWTPDGRNYIARLKNLTGHLRKRLYEGKWVSAEGVVYEDFSNVHLLDAKASKRYRGMFLTTHVGRLVVAIDWGYTHPGVMQLWGVDSDGRMYLLYEYFHTKQRLSWWVERAVEWYNEYPTIEMFVPDPAQPGHVQELENAGLPVVTGYNDILHGIKNLQERFKVADDGKPRIFFTEEALREEDEFLVEGKIPYTTVQELPSYTWKLDKNGKPLVKERPIDEHNHGCDTMRYAAAYIDQLQFATVQGGGGYTGSVE